MSAVGLVHGLLPHEHPHPWLCHRKGQCELQSWTTSSFKEGKYPFQALRALKYLSLARWKPDSFSTMTLDVPALGNISVLIPLDCKGLYFGIAMAASPGCDVKVAKVTTRPSAMCSDIHIGGSNKSSKENNFWNWTFKCIWMIICSSFFADT